MSNYLSLPGAVANATMATSQYRAVRLSGAAPFEVALITDASVQVPVGILQDDPDAAGKGCDVAIVGVCKAEFGGNVSINNHLSVSNNGQLIAAPFESPIGTANLYVIAQALEAGAVNTRGMVKLLSPVPGSLE